MVSAPPVRLAAILALMLAFLHGTAPGQDPPSYGCPMHPEMRSLSPGTCARCGMTLIPMGPLGLPPYRVALDSMPRQVKPGETVRLQFAITHPTTGARVKDLGIVHDMPFHLFIVSDDLEYYDHIHPAQDEDGAFVVDTSFPKAGEYHLFCDFVPIGGTPQVVHLRLATAGARSAAPALRTKLIPDTRLSKTVDGIRFDLTLEPPKVAAGRAAALSYHLSDATTGAPVNDLEPYLGAWGHTLILSDDAERYLHCHPTQLIPPGADRTTLSGGPDVAFNATIRQPGVHRLWSQFKRGGKVTTVSFTIDVARLEHLATWNGTAWSATGPASSAAFDGPVRALAVRGNELFAGGDFQTAGGQGAAGIARWDGRRWQPLGEGVDGTVRAVAIAGNDVYVGGEFGKAGGVAAHAIARWDGRTWSALGSGMSGAKDTARPTAVYAIAVSGRDVYVGGRFGTAGNVPANGIARWDGTRFTPLAGGLASGDFATSFTSAVSF
jgi:hypothetical protein